ncbi:hypothetical protein D3C76_1435680 [compost metagenome]
MPTSWRISVILVFLSIKDTPSMRISPPVGSSSRFRQRRKVDLPEPEGPMTTTTSRVLMSTLIFSRTRLVPKDLANWLTSIILSLMCRYTFLSMYTSSLFKL